MNKIINWTIGSFFRTIGRIIAYIGIGIVITYILSNSNINWGGITDLFFDKVDALNYTTEVQQVGSGWIDISNIQNQNEWTDTYGGYASTINSNTSATMQVRYMIFNTPLDATQYDFISIPFNFTQPIRNLSTNAIKDWECLEWLQTNFGTTQYNGYECKYWYYETEHEDIPYTIQIQDLNFRFQVVYEDGNWNTCDLDNGMLMCPTIHKKITRLEITYIFKTAESTNAVISIGGGFRVYNFNTPTQAIEQQTQQQQQQHEEVMDSNTTEAEEEATSFFDDFDAPDIGGLGAIITAPLNTIRSLLNSSCTNLTLPLPFVNQNLTLPCMNTIYTQHFGAFFTIYQTIILAIIAYRCIRSIFFDIHGFTNPNDDRIEVMDL